MVCPSISHYQSSLCSACNCLSIHITLSVFSLVLSGTVCPSIPHWSSLWSCLELSVHPYQSTLSVHHRSTSLRSCLELSVHLRLGLTWNCLSIFTWVSPGTVCPSSLGSHLELSVHLLLGLTWNCLSIFAWVLPGTVCPSSLGSHFCLKLCVHLLCGLA